MAKPRKPAAHTRTQDELRNELCEQLEALPVLSDAFDKGGMWAAKLMATVVYVICHDGRGRTKSLITQLGLRDELKCVSTARDPEPDNLANLPLTLGIRFDAGVPRLIPRFGMIEPSKFPWLPFEIWWEQPVHWENATTIITRKQLILAVRSQDGGGHFDASLDNEDYVAFRSGAGWHKRVGEEELPPDPTHLLTVWSVAWELFQSFGRRDWEQQSTPGGAGR